MARAVGVTHGNAKLTPEAVRSIRIRRRAGETLDSIAASYPHLDYSTIGNAARRETWKHVADFESLDVWGDGEHMEIWQLP